jgi:hypothetical protein
MLQTQLRLARLSFVYWYAVWRVEREPLVPWGFVCAMAILGLFLITGGLPISGVIRQ